MSGVASPQASHLLHLKRNAKIHSIFSNGFHFVTGGQLVYVSHYPTSFLGAFDLRIEKSALKIILDHIKVGQLVKLQEDSLIFYTRPNILTIQINLQEAPDLRISRLQGIQLKENRHFVLEELKNQRILERSGFPENEQIYPIWRQIINRGTITDQEILQLIGAGKGLTPSGDDFLQGYLMMDLLSGAQGQIRERLIAALKQRNTTDVAYNYYQMLFSGYLSEFWIQLFKTWSIGDQDNIARLIEAITHYGHSSGCDLLLGMGSYIINYFK